MRKKVKHIQRIISTILLMVFAIALTPFSAFHHHEPAPHCYSGNQVKCFHKEHLQNHADTCLICAAHFEKNYTTNQFNYHFFTVNKQILRAFETLSGTYVQLIGSSLRGPPAV